MFLIRSRIRAIISSSKQSHMEMEQSTENQSKPISSFLNSPKFLCGFLSKNMLDYIHHHLDIISASPTSILDTKQFCNNEPRNHHPIGYHQDLFIKPSSSMEKIKHPHEQKGIGLALEEDFDSTFSKPNRKMVLFGAKLKKVQVPEPCLNAETQTTHDVEQSFPSTNNTSDLKSPSDFGIKTKNLQLLPCYDSSSVTVKKKSPEGLSLNEMELSEEYTCVMKHGNDPKIIHIFDDMIVESFYGGGDRNLFDLKKGNNGNSLLFDFLGFCYTCKVKLGDDKDIYIYRGEKSFCSPECRFQEIIKEEDEGKVF